MTLSFRAKLLATHVAVALAVGAVALLVVERSVSRRMEAQLDSRLEAQAHAVARWVERTRHHDRLAGRLAPVVGARVTIFNDKGELVGAPRNERPAAADGELSAEVRAARDGEVGRATRFSPIDNARIRYLAVAAARGFIIRLGLPTDEIEETKSSLRRQLAAGALASILVALGLAALVAGPLTRRLREATAVAERIGAGDYNVSRPSSAADEVGILSRTLADAAAELKATDQRRRDFLATVAHEIRTPVTSIRGYTETLSESDVDSETRGEFVQTIHRNAVRIGTLVEDLLELEALEAGKGRELAAEPVGVAAVAEQVTRTLRAKALDVAATIEVAVDEEHMICGDADALERILLNLADNALRHGGGNLSVTIEAERDGEDMHVTVTDTGSGISDDIRERLFERFQRGGKRGGSGLGLAIARELAQAMNGSLRLLEPETDGAAFRLELPAA